MNDNQTFEVQVYQNGRWQVHTRYPFSERGAALAEAKDLNLGRKHVPIRVIREDYQESTGRHDEVVIYTNGIRPDQTKKAKVKRNKSWADMAVSDSGKIGYMRDDVDEFFFDDDDDYLVRKPVVRSHVSIPMFFGIWLMILVFGAASGAAGGLLLYLLMQGFSVELAPTHKNTALIAMFAIVFLIAASSSFNYYRARFDLNPFRSKEKPKPAVKKTKIAREMEKAAKAIDNAPPVEVDPSPVQEEAKTNIFERLEDEDEIEVSIVEEESDPEAEIFSETAQDQKMFLINYLGICLGTLKNNDGVSPKMNKLGLGLFMCAAADKIGELNGLSAHETYTIQLRLLEMLGSKTNDAERFLGSLDHLSQTPHHQKLMEESGNIVSRFAKGDQSAPLIIADTLMEWQEAGDQQNTDANPNQLIIMFTDLVGSTDLANRHGDYAAQEVLKAHDMIVRSILTNLEGKEIKHLGDGIMASFKDESKAIDAAIEIQKKVEGENNSGPEYPLHVRIGLNVGEPIRKKNDLFGTAVQLAARVCDQAPGDGICLSKALRDLFGDKPIYSFIDLGEKDLKGFDQPQPLFQLDWQAPPIEYPEEIPETVLNAPVAAEGMAPDMLVQRPTNDVTENKDFDEGVEAISEPSETEPKTA